MINRINQINWESLGYRDMPQLFEGLMSSEKGSRSWEQLELHVTRPEVFDGTQSPIQTLSSELPVVVLPFLIEMLDKHLSNDELRLIDNISTLLKYYVDRDRFGQIYGLNEDQLSRTTKMYNIIKKNLVVFERFSKHENTTICLYANNLLTELRKLAKSK